MALAPAWLAYAADIAVVRDGPAFRVTGYRADATPAGGWDSIFQVFAGGEGVPPVMGSYNTEHGQLVFRPRFAIAPGLACRAVFQGRTFRFTARPVEQKQPVTHVQNVYPSGGMLPANQLKIYLQFSAPMRHGEAWEHVRLLDESGKTVELAFLEIEQELWDRESRRLTLLFDPGRIKRGVLPREDAGAALIEGKRYTLIVDQAWRDQTGTPLVSAFRKEFVAGPEDRSPVMPEQWALQMPRAGTRQALIIGFGEPLDAPLAERLISVEGVAGKISLGKEEREWWFVPDAEWKPGEYRIAVDTALEDLAGNRVGRPFDVDTFDRVTVRTGRGTVYRSFRIGGQ